MRQLTTEELNKGLDEILQSPADAGLIEMLVLRPEVDHRDVVETLQLIEGSGARGDNYVTRGSSRTEDGRAHPEAQITIMNSRVLQLLSAGDRDRWPWAGDQILVDMDLSTGNLPTATRLRLGSALLEVTAKPHTGCGKFSQRFGLDAVKWVNHDPDLRLRGLNAAVIESGSCSVGDVITKVG